MIQNHATSMLFLSVVSKAHDMDVPQSAALELIFADRKDHALSVTPLCLVSPCCVVSSE